jgi:hypothetical protein
LEVREASERLLSAQNNLNRVKADPEASADELFLYDEVVEGCWTDLNHLERVVAEQDLALFRLLPSAGVADRAALELALQSSELAELLRTDEVARGRREVHNAQGKVRLKERKTRAKTLEQGQRTLEAAQALKKGSPLPLNLRTPPLHS